MGNSHRFKGINIEIWSGAQTGTDREAQDFALELGMGHGGWVPAGRLAKDGWIESRYMTLVFRAP